MGISTRRSSAPSSPVAWRSAGLRRNGIADSTGSRDVLRAFSIRRREIEMHLEEHGETGARAAQSPPTRPAKPRLETPAESLLPKWRARSVALGPTTTVCCRPLSCRGRVLFRSRGPRRALFALWPPVRAYRVFQRLSASRGPPSDRRRVPTGGTSTTPRARRRVPRLGPRRTLDPVGLRAADVIRRRDGAIVVTYVDEPAGAPRRCSPPNARIDAALGRRPRRCRIARREHVRRAINARPSSVGRAGPHGGQITASGAGVDAVEGVAG